MSNPDVDDVGPGFDDIHGNYSSLEERMDEPLKVPLPSWDFKEFDFIPPTTRQDSTATLGSIDQDLHHAFLAVAPGNEANLINELTRKGIVPQKELKKALGGLETFLPLGKIYEIIATSTILEDVKIRLATPFRCFSLQMLQKRIEKIDFADTFIPGTPIKVTVVCSESSQVLIRERMKAMIEEAAVKQGLLVFNHSKVYSIPVQHMELRVFQNEATLSVDACTDLYKRNQSKWSVEGSMRETVASTMITMTRKYFPDGDFVLWDPFCGSGTLLEEMTRNRGEFATPPFHDIVNMDHEPAFFHWARSSKSHFIDIAEKKATIQHELAVQTEPCFSLIGSDISPRAIDAAKHNMEALNQRLSRQKLKLPSYRLIKGEMDEVYESTIKDYKNVVLFSNPPYGMQVNSGLPGEAPTQLYTRIRKLATKANIKAAFVATHGEAFLRSKVVGSRWEIAGKTKSGGLTLKFLYKMIRR